MSRMVGGHDGRLLPLDEQSKEPALAAGTVTAVGTLATYIGTQLLGADPKVVAGLLVLAGPLITAAWARYRAWSGRTVAEVLDRQLDQATRP